MTSVLKVDTIQNSSGTDALSISSTGGLLPKGQNAWPAFRVALTDNQNESATGSDVTVVWDRTSGQNCYLQGGMTINSGVITVPVDGIYLFSAVLRVDNANSGYIIGNIIINNDPSDDRDAYIIAGSPSGSYENLTGSAHFKLSAGDTVRTTVHSQSDTSWRINSNASFSGSLIAAE